MNFLELAKSVLPDFDKIELIAVKDDLQNIIGWEANAYLNNGYPISGGLHSNQQTAIRICVAELIERCLVKFISTSNEANKFRLEAHPGTCGFAAGFECEKTKQRAIGEGLERWAWSKWIDEGHNISHKTLLKKDLTPISIYIIEQFEKLNFYSREIKFKDTCYDFNVVVAEVNSGVFAGSRVTITGSMDWEHAFVEAYRNLKNYQAFNKNRNQFDIYKNIIRSRAIYFAEHKEVAFEQINRATQKIWPNPELLILEEYKNCPSNTFLFRCLMKDYIPWHLGDEKRFVY